MPTHSRWHVRRIALVFHGRPPYPKSRSEKGMLGTSTGISRPRIFQKYILYRLWKSWHVSHVQMAACLAQWAVPQMIRESVRWSEWEELPFVPPPHPHHPKSNKVVQSFCSAKNFHLLLSSPPSLPSWRCFASFLTSSQVDCWSSVMLPIPPSSAHLAGRSQLFRSQRLHLQMCPCRLRGSGMMASWAHWFLTCCSLNKERNESVIEIVKSWMRPVGRTFPLSRKLHLTTYRREHWGARLGATPEWMALCQLPCHQAHSLLVSLICPSPFSLSPSLTHPPPLLCSFHKLRTPSPFFFSVRAWH